MHVRTARHRLVRVIAALSMMAASAHGAAVTPDTAHAATARQGAHRPAVSGESGTVTRCGWFENPSPGNATLTDRDGTWVIARQGGHQAEGDWPGFSDSRWVRSGAGSYGRGCGCIAATVDADSRMVQKISRAWSRPLKACRADGALTEPQD